LFFELQFCVTTDSVEKIIATNKDPKAPILGLPTSG
jgi:electron transfer flavoprotein alpha subunit